MNVSPLDLRQQRFRSGFRGFDKVEVTAFLAAVADDYEQALRETDRLRQRSEEHTSELQSRFDLVCRLLLEKKKKPPDRTDQASARSSRRGSGYTFTCVQATCHL